jgi:hypothetical protein
MSRPPIRCDLSAERVREVLNYCPLTGALHWKAVRNRPDLAGKLAGSINAHTGYHEITVDGVKYLAHRLAWLHFYGRWPADLLDHEHGIKTDLRIAKLREANPTQNSQNRMLPPHNTSGHKGVFRRPGSKPFRARIRVNGQAIHLGVFKTLEGAAAAYDQAAGRYFGEFARSEGGR